MNKGLDKKVSVGHCLTDAFFVGKELLVVICKWICYNKYQNNDTY